MLFDQQTPVNGQVSKQTLCSTIFSAMHIQTDDQCQ